MSIMRPDLDDPTPSPAEVALVNACDTARCLRLLVGLTQRVVFLDGRAVAMAALERLLELVEAER
jgi:hypothetical protein